jgi:hypothetical protein
MRNDTNDYLSEFEREFEMEFEHDSEYELGDSESDSEFELGDSESDSEYELEDSESDNEFELDDVESESDNEFELDSENDLETRLYEVLNGDHESEYEFEQQLNELMHEAERDFFWKKAFRKVGAFANKLKNNPLVRKGLSLALKATPMGAVLSSLPIGDIVKAASQVSRQGLRSGLTQLATNYAQNNLGGIGNMLAGAVQGEASNGISRGQVRDFLNIAEQAYENLADEINKVDRAKSPQQVQQILKIAPKVALSNAIQTAKTRGYGKSRLATRRVIPLPTGAKVLVTRTKVVIITPKKG